MVRNHVPQSTGGFIVRTTLAHTHGLGGGNLNIIDIAPIPNRLKDTVGKTEHHQVLDGFLAQVVIYSEDLFFFQDLFHFDIEFHRRSQISTERLFDDDPAPAVTVLFRHAGSAEFLDDGSKVTRGCCQIVEMVVADPLFGLNRLAMGIESPVERVITKIAIDVGDAAAEPVKKFKIYLIFGVLPDGVQHLFVKGALVHGL